MILANKHILDISPRAISPICGDHIEALIDNVHVVLNCKEDYFWRDANRTLYSFFHIDETPENFEIEDYEESR